MEIVSIDNNEIDLLIISKLILSYLPDTKITSYSTLEEIKMFVEDEYSPDVVLISSDFLKIAGLDWLDRIKKKTPSSSIYITTSFVTIMELELVSPYDIKDLIEKPISKNVIFKLAEHCKASEEKKTTELRYIL